MVSSRLFATSRSPNTVVPRRRLRRRRSNAQILPDKEFELVELRKDLAVAQADIKKRAAKDQVVAQGDIKRLENCAAKIEQRLARIGLGCTSPRLLRRLLLRLTRLRRRL